MPLFKEKEMRKEVEIKIPYVEKGKELEKTVKVKFVSNKVTRDFNEIMTRLNKSFGYYAEIKKLNQKIADIVADKKIHILRKRAEAKPYVSQIAEIKKQIKNSDEQLLLDDRIKLIKIILEDNECQDPELMTVKFWDEKTEPTQSWDFLTKAVMKDQKKEDSKKKKNMNSMKIY